VDESELALPLSTDRYGRGVQAGGEVDVGLGHEREGGTRSSIYMEAPVVLGTATWRAVRSGAAVTKTLHTWRKQHVRPIPAVHLGLGAWTPADLEEAVLRTIGEDPIRDWLPGQIPARIPDGRPTGAPEEVA
jgi:hypothetical protein